MRYCIYLLSFISLFLCLNVQNTYAQNLPDQVSQNSLKMIENKIAGKQFEGRMAASKGDSLAIQFISNWFKTYHLTKPYKTTNSYLQDVPLIHSDYSNSTLSVQGKQFSVDNQWTYFNNTNTLPHSTAEVVFIGYGLSVPNYDDLKNIDIDGKFVVMSWDSPKDSTGKYLLDEKNMPDEINQVTSILNKKPLGILVYAPDFKSELEQLNYFRTTEPFRHYSHLNFPKITGGIISGNIFNLLIGRNADSLYSLIGNSGKPHSFNTHKQLALSINKQDKKVSSQNIIGLIKGRDINLPCIVFTAHHDHLGIIDGKTYYGADDNGSGTTALLEIARILGDAVNKGMQPKRTIVFVSTAAEEQGLIGGHYYVDNPVVPLNKTYCNINIDMLGRVDSFYTGKKKDSNYVYCMFNDRSTKVFNYSKLNSINQKYSQLILDTLYDKESKAINPYSLISRSDNFPFMEKGIPALWFFSGFHKDYHQPTDTPDKINYPLLKRRTQFVLATLWKLANE